MKIKGRSLANIYANERPFTNKTNRVIGQKVLLFQSQRLVNRRS